MLGIFLSRAQEKSTSDSVQVENPLKLKKHPSFYGFKAGIGLNITPDYDTDTTDHENLLDGENTYPGPYLGFEGHLGVVASFRVSNSLKLLSGVDLKYAEYKQYYYYDALKYKFSTLQASVPIALSIGLSKTADKDEGIYFGGQYSHIFTSNTKIKYPDELIENLESFNSANYLKKNYWSGIIGIIGRYDRTFFDARLSIAFEDLIDRPEAITGNTHFSIVPISLQVGVGYAF